MSDLKLRVEPKPVAQVNKMLVLSTLAVFVFLVLLAVVYAFRDNKNVKGSISAIKATTDKPLVVDPSLKDLPGNYSDVNAIKKYSSSSQNSELEILQRQVDQLKIEHDALEKQLSTVNKSGNENRDDDPQTQQAKNSGLVFGGIGSSGMENLIGGSGPQVGSIAYPPPANNLQTNVISPTPQQATFLAKQAQDAQKVAVIKAADNPEDIYDLHNVVTPASPYEIQAGTVIPATLITGINTTLSGTVVAQVRQNIYDSVGGKYLLVPRGSKLIGEYESRVTYGQRRVLIAFTRIIRPDGTSILLGKPTSADLQGQAGMEGNVDNHWGRVLGAATISTILSVGAGVAADSVGGGGNTNYRSAGQGAILGGAQGIAQVGQGATTRALDIQPTITLPAGYQFNVIVKKDMVLTPYNSNR